MHHPVYMNAGMHRYKQTLVNVNAYIYTARRPNALGALVVCKQSVFNRRLKAASVAFGLQLASPGFGYQHLLSCHNQISLTTQISWLFPDFGPFPWLFIDHSRIPNISRFPEMSKKR